MQAVILAAGRGTRLGGLAVGRSKAMMPVAGRPMAGRVAASLMVAAPESLVVVVRPDDREIRAAFDDLPVPARFVVQNEPRGMADALWRAAPLISGDFLLSACDNLVAAADVNRLLARWRARPRPDALLSLLPSSPEKLSASGVVALEGEQVTRIVEKPRPGEAPSAMVSLPLYLFRRDLLDLLPSVRPSSRGEMELQDAIQRLIDGGGLVAGLEISGRRTVTTAADLLALNLDTLELAGDLPAPPDLPPGTRLAPPVLVEPGARVGANCVLGPRVYIERGGRVGDRARLRDTIVLRGGSVADGADLAGVLVG
jgi:NDP-sugar pyrophosphorylase family protein